MTRRDRTPRGGAKRPRWLWPRLVVRGVSALVVATVLLPGPLEALLADDSADLDDPLPGYPLARPLPRNRSTTRLSRAAWRRGRGLVSKGCSLTT